MKAYIDQGVNQKILKKLVAQHKFEIVQGHRTEDRIKGATQIGEPFTIGVSMIGGMDRLAGNNLDDVVRLIGKNNGADIDHLYSAYMEGCQYFVTDNPRDFIRAVRKDKASTGKRDELEKILTGLRIVTLDEFVREL